MKSEVDYVTIMQLRPMTTDQSHLDPDKIDGNDWFLQRGKVGVVQRLAHHHFGRHVNEVHADCLRNKGERARRSQVALDHLQERGWGAHNVTWLRAFALNGI